MGLGGNDGRSPSLRYFWGAILFIVLVWLANLIFLPGFSAEKRGTFGDMFGVANSLFSGLAFCGVVYAILLQRQEVEIARSELERTKHILEDQSSAINRQNSANEKKSFEDTFFQLLTIHNEILNSIDLQGPTVTTGRDVFTVMLKRLGSTSSWNYDEFYNKNGQELGHYFRILYNIFKFIDERTPGDCDPHFYGNLARAQMSDKEVALLYFNGLSQHGKKFKPLIEKYRLLKHIKRKDIENGPIVKGNYSASAFGEPPEYPEWMR